MRCSARPLKTSFSFQKALNKHSLCLLFQIHFVYSGILLRRHSRNSIFNEIIRIGNADIIVYAVSFVPEIGFRVF